MRYLIFDIECANWFDNVGKITSFGYVVANEKFEILEYDDIVIDPEVKFDSYVLKKMMKYDKNFIYAQPNFCEFNDKISSLINEKNQIILGHTMNRDALSLIHSTLHCKLQPYNFDFVNIEEIYKHFEKPTEGFSLEKICNFFDIDCTEELHKSSYDALLTMKAAKAMSDKYEMSIAELAEKVSLSNFRCLDCKIYQKNEENDFVDLDDGKNKIRGYNKIIFSRFLQRNVEIENDRFNNKYFYFSKAYSSGHFIEMMAIANFLKKNGAKLAKYRNTADFCVVNKKLSDVDNSKFKAEILTFDEFFALANCSKKQFFENYKPEVKYFEIDYRQYLEKKVDKSYQSERSHR